MSNICLLIFLLSVYSIVGTVIIILDKYLNKENFSHSFLLNLLMFFAEIFALPLYYYLSHRGKKNQIKNLEEDKERSEEEIEMNLTLCQISFLILPCLLDSVATFLINICIIFFSSILFFMIKGILLILFTFIISRCFIKNKHTWDHYFSILIAVIGFIFFGISGDFKSRNIALGIGTLFIAMICQSIQLSFEEYYMIRYHVHPFLCVGIEGIFGFILNLILCIIFYYIKCSENFILLDFCTKDNNNIYRVENAIYAFEQLNNNKILILVLVLFIFLIPFNIIGISITKYGGALTKSLIENFKSPLSWLFFLIPFDGDLKENFDIWKLIGFFIILGSLLIYFGILRIEERIMIRRKLKSLNNMDDLSGGIINASKADASFSSESLDKLGE